MDADDSKPLSELLPAWRKTAGLSQVRLAESVGIHWRTVQQVEAGMLHFGRENAEAVARALKLNKADRALLMGFVRKSPAKDLQRRHDELEQLVAGLSNELETLQSQVAQLSALLDDVERWRRGQG